MRRHDGVFVGGGLMLAAWHKIDLTTDEVASGAHLRMMEEFHREFMSRRSPPDAAMFCRGTPGTDYEVIFSPQGAELVPEIIARRGGAACDPPARAAATLLVGLVDAANRLLA
jgi:hypothetical protein